MHQTLGRRVERICYLLLASRSPLSILADLSDKVHWRIRSTSCYGSATRQTGYVVAEPLFQLRVSLLPGIQSSPSSGSGSNTNVTSPTPEGIISILKVAVGSEMLSRWIISTRFGSMESVFTSMSHGAKLQLQIRFMRQ